MALNCRIVRNPNDNSIERVEAPNGNESILYKEALARFGDPKTALDVYTVAELNEFKEIHKKPAQFQKRDSATIQQPQNILNQVLDQLKKTGLANNTYVLTNQQIEDKLKELGYSDEIVKSVIAYHGTTREFRNFLQQTPTEGRYGQILSGTYFGEDFIAYSFAGGTPFTEASGTVFKSEIDDTDFYTVDMKGTTPSNDAGIINTIGEQEFDKILKLKEEGKIKGLRLENTREFLAGETAPTTQYVVYDTDVVNNLEQFRKEQADIFRPQFSRNSGIKDVNVLITPATVRSFNEETSNLKKLTDEYANITSKIIEGDKKSRDNFEALQNQILETYTKEVKEKVSSIEGVDVFFKTPYIGSWEGNYEPSLNMSLKIRDNANTEDISNLLFDLAESTSQDAFILEETSEITDRTPLTEFDDEGYSHYPQFKVNFKSEMTTDEKVLVAQMLNKNKITEFSIDGDYFIVSLIDFSETIEEKNKNYEEIQNAITTLFGREGEKIGTNKVRNLQENIRKSKYVGARNEGNEQTQTRDYDRSDLFKKKQVDPNPAKNDNLNLNKAKGGVTVTTNGFVLDNDVYINSEASNPTETAIHEFAHGFLNKLKTARPKLYKKGMELVEGSKKDYKVIDDLENTDTIQLNFEGGSVSIGEAFGYDFLEEYDNEFRDPNFFIEIQDVKVELGNRGKGVGTKMMQDTIDFIYEKYGVIDIYLNASNTDPNAMSDRQLAEWYKNFGFKEILDEGNVLMVKKAHLKTKIKNEAQPYIKFVKQNQPNLEEGSEAFKNEVLAQVIGDNGAKLIDNQNKEVKNWLSQFFDWIKKQLSLTQMTDEQVANLTLKEYADAVGVDLLSGETLFEDETPLSQAIKRNNGNPMSKAPNGKPSILYQSYKDLGYTDKQAEELTAQVYSDNFKEWFGDWQNDFENASKVVDSNTQPLMVYHGSSNNNINYFNSFSYFTPNKEYANKYTGIREAKSDLYPTFISINNPLDGTQWGEKPITYDYVLNKLKRGLNLKESQKQKIKDIFRDRVSFWQSVDASRNEISELLQELGFDSISQIESYDGKDENVAYITFNPNQIKSATDNQGSFAPQNNNIYFQKQGNQLLIEKINFSEDFRVQNQLDKEFEELTEKLDNEGVTAKVAISKNDPEVLIYQSHGFSLKGDFEMVRTPQPKDNTFDSNGEPKLDTVLNFIESKKAEGKRLTDIEKLEVESMLRIADLSNSAELQTELNKLFRNNNLLPNALQNSNLFFPSEASTILANKEYQTNIKDLRDKLNNLDEPIQNSAIYEEQFLVFDGTTNKYGKDNVKNPLIVEKEIAEVVAGIENREDFNNAFNEIDYPSIIEEYNSNEEFAQKMYEKFSSMTKLNVFNESFEPTMSPSRLSSMVETADLENSNLTPKIDFLRNIPPSIWEDSQEEIEQGLSSIENNTNIDLEGITDTYTTKTQEEIVDFLDSLATLERDTTEENFNNFQEQYKTFFNIKEEQAVDIEDLPPQHRDKTLVKVDDTNTSEYKLFEEHSLIKVMPGVYQQVQKTSLENLYESIYAEATLNDFRVLPNEAYEMNGKVSMENKEAVLESIKMYVEDNAPKMDLGTSIFDTDVAHQLFLLKSYFNNPIKVGNDVEFNKRVLGFEGNSEYLSTQYLSDFQTKKLKERNKNSELYQMFYNKFDINDKGILPNSTDVITLKEIETSAKVLLPKKDLRDFKDYTVISKNPILNGMFTEDLPSNALYTKLDHKNFYQNNPKALESFKGEYTNVGNEGITTFETSQDFIRINDRLLEKTQTEQGQSFYKEILTNQSNFNMLTDVELINKFDYTEIKPYLRNSKTIEKTNNLYNQEQLREIDEKGFDCT